MHSPRCVVCTAAAGQGKAGIHVVQYEEWAGPRSTAILGQPVAKAEQAPDTSPSSKNQFNIVVSQWETYQILS